MTTAHFDVLHPALAQDQEIAAWHDDSAYLASTSGRIACATLTFALAAAAGLALFGTAANATLLIPLITLVCIMGGFFATGLALERHGTMALAYVLSLPPVGGAYFAGLFSVAGAGLPLALLLLVLAAVPVVLLVRARIAI